MNELESEWGSSQPIGFANALPYDEHGNEIKAICKCGKQAYTCLRGVKYYTWACNDCLYGKREEVKLIYKKPDKPAKIEFGWSIDLRKDND